MIMCAFCFDGKSPLQEKGKCFLYYVWFMICLHFRGCYINLLHISKYVECELMLSNWLNWHIQIGSIVDLVLNWNTKKCCKKGPFFPSISNQMPDRSTIEPSNLIRLWLCRLPNSRHCNLLYCEGLTLMSVTYIINCFFLPLRTWPKNIHANTTENEMTKPTKAHGVKPSIVSIFIVSLIPVSYSGRVCNNARTYKKFCVVYFSYIRHAYNCWFSRAS